MKLRFFSLGLAAATVLGCGNKSGPGSSGSAADVESFCRSLISSLVAKATTCYRDNQRNWKQLFETLWSCDELKAAVSAGRMSYDPAAGALCLSKELTTECHGGIGTELSPECEAAFVGHVGTGEHCHERGFTHFECAAPNHCGQDDSSCNRTCRSYPEPSSDWSFPPMAKEGQRCDTSGFVVCEDGLYCAGDDGLGAETGNCRKQKTSGLCKIGSECAWGYSCRHSNNGVSDKVTCTQQKYVGESCTPGEFECIWGYACADNGKCVPSDSLKQGDSCPKREAVLCDFGLHCDYAAGTCQPDKPNGAPCDPGPTSSGCAGEGSYCDEVTKTCVDCT